MDDYISRQAAIDTVKYDYFTGYTQLERVNEIKAIPAADVVPVVRCRDCKHWDNGNLSFECPWDYGRHGSSDGDDFCSYGERKE